MFFVIGVRNVTYDMGTVGYYCKSCAVKWPHKALAIKGAFTFFWIPVIPAGTEKQVFCTRCGFKSTFHLQSLNAMESASLAFDEGQRLLQVYSPGCTDCGSFTVWISQYNKWYCNQCCKYMKFETIKNPPTFVPLPERKFMFGQPIQENGIVAERCPACGSDIEKGIFCPFCGEKQIPKDSA